MNNKNTFYVKLLKIYNNKGKYREYHSHWKIKYQKVDWGVFCAFSSDFRIAVRDLASGPCEVAANDVNGGMAAGGFLTVQNISEYDFLGVFLFGCLKCCLVAVVWEHEFIGVPRL